VYRNPVERSHELREIYTDSTPTSDALRSLHETQRPAMDAQARRLRDVLGRGGSGLEVGSYVGAFLAAARDVGLQMEGVDVSASVNAFTRSLGFTVHDGELTTMPAERDGRADAVAIWNTFDQLQAPREAVTAARRLLRADGVLVIRVPNGAFYARLRSRLARGGVRRSVAGALLAQNNLLGFPYRAGFSPSSLTRFVTESGFRVEKVFGDTLVPIADEWTRPWARAEERIIKVLLRLAARGADWAPWFELYARRI
jgi:SAM-dependent methyltransferase